MATREEKQCEADLDYWYSMKIEQVKVEPARFPNDIATNLAALDFYMEDIRSDLCFVDTEAAQTDLDLCNELNGFNADPMFQGDCFSRGLLAGLDDHGRTPASDAYMKTVAASFGISLKQRRTICVNALLSGFDVPIFSVDLKVHAN